MFDVTYLSLGCGVQSSALFAMSCLGVRDVPRADFAIFADTQNEPKWVYDQLRILREFGIKKGIPVYVATKGNLAQTAIDRNQGKISRFANIPLWTTGQDGRAVPLRRQCTREFKVEVIEKKVRQLMGYQPRQRVKHKVRSMIGISTDEAQRMKPSRTKWVESTFPLCDLMVSRQGCENFLRSIDLPVPNKSACVQCPYRSDVEWMQMKQDSPEDFEQACVYDELMRDQKKSGLEWPAFVHRSLIPLREVEFKPKNGKTPLVTLWDSFTDECEGMCGV